jgi:hypothetical protein
MLRRLCVILVVSVQVLSLNILLYTLLNCLVAFNRQLQSVEHIIPR